MTVSAEFRNALESGDVRMLRKIWAEVSPHLPQPKDDAEAEIVMHRARTEAESVSFKHRAYSHRWLTERNYPSGLPDRLKPSADRLYPIVVEGVGIAVMASSRLMQPVAKEIRKAMEYAVEDAFAEGRRDSEFVSARMREARKKAISGLFGRSALSIPKG